MPVTIERCNTPNDLLHRLVREGLPELRRALDEADRQLPRYVERELERFTTCGDPSLGFAWLKCESCDHHRLVPFPCKGRGFCPSCGGRRMTERGARWVDEMIPRVAVRQWVITVPWPRRLLLARQPELARGVLKVALREIQRWLRKRTRQPAGQGGSVTVAQRFGSALNLNLHFHALVLDGVYTEDSDTGAVHWHRAPAPTDEEVAALVERIADRAEAWLARRGYGPDEEQADSDPDDAQQAIQAAAVAGRSAVRRGRRARRVQVLGGRPYQLPPKCANCDGYGLHAGVVIGARDRKGLERMCRYIARPPLAKPRLEERPGGGVRIRFKRPWSDGTEAIELSRVELVERLAALVPPPRANTVLYHGVLAARSALRERVRPRGRRRSQPRRAAAARLAKKPSATSRWVPWAWLLWRAFEVDSWACPRCGQRMRLRTVVMAPATLEVLESLRQSARGPPSRTEESAVA